MFKNMKKLLPKNILPKKVSFWCVVLFIVVAMVVHHILSDKPLIEGQENAGKINMKDVSNIKIKMKGPPEFMERIFQKPPVESEEEIVGNETPEVVAPAAGSADAADTVPAVPTVPDADTVPAAGSAGSADAAATDAAATDAVAADDAATDAAATDAVPATGSGGNAGRIESLVAAASAN